MTSFDDQQFYRGTAARLGLLLLNLVAPGLGLIRLGRIGEGASFLFGFPVAITISTIIARSAPVVGPRGYLAMMIMAVGGYAFVLLVSTFRVWRFARFVEAQRSRSQRWYGLVALYALSLAVSFGAVEFGRTAYKSYYLPAASMEPGLAVDDQLVAAMRAQQVKRGDIVIVKVGRFDYIKRVAAVGGDWIKLVKGVVFINGIPARQRKVGTYASDGRNALRLSERFPGEVNSHEILDFGPKSFDDIDEQTIPANHYYLLGDSRDNSADSRVTRGVGGIGGAVPATDLRGQVLFISFDSRMRWVGQAVR